MPWYFHANVMARTGAMYAPIVPCRLSPHIGEYGRAPVQRNRRGAYVQCFGKPLHSPLALVDWPKSWPVEAFLSLWYGS